MVGPLVRMERKQKQIGNRYYTASILGLPEGSVWLQQSLHVSLGKISEALEVVLKHRPAYLSLHPSIHPSLLLDPLLPLIHIWNYKSPSYGWLITHVMTKFKCESICTAQKAIEILSERSWWSQLLLSIYKVTRCLNALKFCGCRLKTRWTLSPSRALNPFYNMPFWEEWLILLCFWVTAHWVPVYSVSTSL